MAKSIAPVPAPGSAPAGSGKVVNASGAPSKNTTLIKKSHSKSVDPYAQQPAGPAYVYAAKERGGASYGIQVGFEAHVAPEASMTQSNGRILQNVINRSVPNFRTGMVDYN